MIALARYNLAQGNMSACELQCIALLRVNSKHRDGGMMLADLMLRKNNYENAALYFNQLLMENPHEWSALARLITLLQQSGKLDTVETI